MQSNRPPREELQRIWNAIQKDPEGASALATLKANGFNLASIPVESYTWSGMLASLPFLTNRRTRSSSQPSFRSARPLIQFLREMARAAGTPYYWIAAYDRRADTIYIDDPKVLEPLRWTQAAEVLERFFSMRWVVTQRNPQRSTIASLRWEIRHRTGKPRDRELVALIDAAFRAAGKEGFRMEFEALKKIENHERASRMASRRKLLTPITHRDEIP